MTKYILYIHLCFNFIYYLIEVMSTNKLLKSELNFHQKTIIFFQIFIFFD